MAEKTAVNWVYSTVDLTGRAWVELMGKRMAGMSAAQWVRMRV
jgi:hypothetical protein